MIFSLVRCTSTILALCRIVYFIHVPGSRCFELTEDSVKPVQYSSGSDSGLFPTVVRSSCSFYSGRAVIVVTEICSLSAQRRERTVSLETTIGLFGLFSYFSASHEHVQISVYTSSHIAE